MIYETNIFEEKGFPTIVVSENEFKIKARDHWDFRNFSFSDVQSISHYNPNSTWFMRLYIASSLTGSLFAHRDPWILKIKYKNGGDWTYKTFSKPNARFREAIRLIKKKLK